MKKPYLIFLFSCFSILLTAQFAPSAGQPGSTAIAKDDIRISAWATASVVERGWINIQDTTIGKATVGNTSAVLGEALSAGVLSLGDGGIVTCSFLSGIINNAGYDFAVFENSFQDDFLELAFVEVSSDGIKFVRFPATSYTQDSMQIDTFGLIDARHINNLAGKYKAGYGTPFDLDELIDSVGIDLNDIVYVRVVDVVGNINPLYTSYDHQGHKVNDPWPTPFPSCGFDLDAIAVMNPKYDLGIKNSMNTNNWNVYPTLFDQMIFVLSEVDQNFELINSSGQKVGILNSNQYIDAALYAYGLYLVRNPTDNSYIKVVKQ